MSYNNFENFRNSITGDPNWAPATSNLFGVTIDPPKCAERFLPSTRAEWYDKINLLSQEVTVPSRQLTTGEGKTFGSMYRYATGNTFSEISISFLLTKDLSIRLWFERWMNYTQADTSNFVLTHQDYATKIRISKWETGANVVIQNKDSEGKITGRKRLRTCTGNWIIDKAFPFNISTVSFNNDETTLLKCDVSFYYDRYKFDNTGASGTQNGLGGGTRYIDNANNGLGTYVNSIRSLGDQFAGIEYE